MKHDDVSVGSQRGHSSSAVRTNKPPPKGRLSVSVALSGSDIADCGLAAAAVLLGIERYFLALDKIAHPGALKRGRMHKHFSTIVGLDKAKALLRVIKFHCP
jgi:hypothetical protein